MNGYNLLSDLSFCVIDLETTGGNHKSDEIIEIGLVKIEKLEISDKRSFLLKPSIPIPDFIQKLTGIKQKDVENCPSIQSVIEEVIEFIGNTILVAHNISFDIPFLNAVLDKMDKPFLKNRVICTNVMTKHMIPEIMNSNLNYMSRLFDLGLEKAHRAQQDATATAELLLKYLEIFIKKDIRKVNQLYYPRNKFELDRHNYTNTTPNQEIVDSIKDCNSPLIITLKGDKGIILGVLPIEHPPEELSIIEKFLNENEWNICTIKLTGQILDGLINMNHHINKFEEKNLHMILEHLEQRYQKPDKIKYRLHDLDFVMAPHLIQEQIVIYPFLNLKSNSKFIFKYPSHRKKMGQYLNSKINYFTNNLNEKRKNNISESLFSIFENVLNSPIDDHQRIFYFLTVKKFRKNNDSMLSELEQFNMSIRRKFKFPSNFL